MRRFAFLLLLLLLSSGLGAQNVVRLQEIASVGGVQDNDLFGIGVVVGLNGTGDSNPATRARLSSFLAHNKINVDPGQLVGGNIAMVSVTSQLPPFIRPGDRIDVTLSAIQDCQSLFGGELLFSTLKGIDGEVYVVSQGPVSIGGFSASGGAAKVTRNHPTVGHIPNGGRVEKAIPMRLISQSGHLEIRIHRPAFDTAANLVRSVSTLLPGQAQAIDAGLIQIDLQPKQKENPGSLVELIAKLYNLPVQVGGKSRVVINERTGTVVVGEHVRVGKCSLAKGNLTISITENPIAISSGSMIGAQNTILDRSSVDAVEGNQFMKIKGGASLADVVETMNALGASPRDIIDILQNLNRAGVLHAELEIM